MDYRRVYAEFISDRRTKETSLTIFCTHHILPRSLGGTNDSSNLIRLTDSDHLFAHLMLAKIHGGVMTSTAVMMLNFQRYRGRTSRLQYQSFRDEHRRLARSRAKGNKHSLGRILSEEHLQILSNTMI